MSTTDDVLGLLNNGLMMVYSQTAKQHESPVVVVTYRTYSDLLKAMSKYRSIAAFADKSGFDKFQVMSPMGTVDVTAVKSGWRPYEGAPVLPDRVAFYTTELGASLAVIELKQPTKVWVGPTALDEYFCGLNPLPEVVDKPVQIERSDAPWRW